LEPPPGPMPGPPLSPGPPLPLGGGPWLSPPSGGASQTSGAPGGVTPVSLGKQLVSVSRQAVIASVGVAAFKQVSNAVKQSTALACVAVALVVAEVSALDVESLGVDEQAAMKSGARHTSARRKSVLLMRSSKLKTAVIGYSCLVPRALRLMKATRDQS